MLLSSEFQDISAETCPPPRPTRAPHQKPNRRASFVDLATGRPPTQASSNSIRFAAVCRALLVLCTLVVSFKNNYILFHWRVSVTTTQVFYFSTEFGVNNRKRTIFFFDILLRRSPFSLSLSLVQPVRENKQNYAFHKRRDQIRLRQS